MNEDPQIALMKLAAHRSPLDATALPALIEPPGPTHSSSTRTPNAHFDDVRGAGEASTKKGRRRGEFVLVPSPYPYRLRSSLIAKPTQLSPAPPTYRLFTAKNPSNGCAPSLDLESLNERATVNGFRFQAVSVCCSELRAQASYGTSIGNPSTTRCTIITHST